MFLRSSFQPFCHAALSRSFSLSELLTFLEFNLILFISCIYLTALSVGAETVQFVSKMIGQVSAVPRTKTPKTFPPTIFGVQSNNVWTLK